jgi:hypothetical protein
MNWRGDGSPNEANQFAGSVDETDQPPLPVRDAQPTHFGR